MRKPCGKAKRCDIALGVGAALVVAVAFWALDARAGVAIFDMDGPGPDQVGDYETSDEVVREGGVAFLAEQAAPDWALPEWSYRLAVTIHNDTGSDALDMPVRIDLEGAPALLFDDARIDGADLVVVDDTGAEVRPYWLERFDTIARQGALWIRPARLASGDSTFYLYFGNPDRDDPGNAESVFTYTTERTTAVVLGPVASGSGLVIQSFVDGNSITVGQITLSLDTRALGQVSADDLTSPTLVSALGPYYGAYDTDGTDALSPLVYAATTFIYPSPRYADNLDLYAPLSAAEVTVFDGTTQVAQASLAAGQAMSLAADVADGHALRIESDQPVVVSRRVDNAGTTYDAMPYLAPALELVGADSGNTLLAALEDGTQVEIYDSSPGHWSVTLDAGQVYALANAGSQGNGPAVHILASAPVAAISYGDGDGGESVTFLPRRELGRRYLIPRTAQYVLVASPTPAVTCRILDGDGQVVGEQISDAYAPYYPNRLFFSGVAAGSELSCDAPVFAMMEDQATNDERNLWPMKAHRPLLFPEPTADLGEVETRYPDSSGWLVTPTLQPEDGLSALIGFLQTAQVPAGTSLRYQLSPDQGGTWYYFDGEEWAQAAGVAQANDAYELGRAISSFDASSGSVTFRAVLASPSGLATPVLDELKVGWAGFGEAVRLQFDPIDATQVAGIPFDVTLTAVDSLGLRVQDFSGRADLATLHASTFPERTPAFENGRVTFSVAVGEIGDNVVLLARSGMLMGQSNPFVVVAPDPSGLSLETVSGDQQAGTVGQQLSEPLVVRVSDRETGAAIPAQQVTFRVTEGGGMLWVEGQVPASELSVRSDAAGLAQVFWTLGPQPGANRAEALLDGAQGSPRSFLARADPEGAEPVDQEYWASGGGGCSCRSSGPTGPALWWLLLVVGVFVLRSRSRR